MHADARDNHITHTNYKGDNPYNDAHLLFFLYVMREMKVLL